ncbi:GNAT family N-acetyltransferase, partial [Pseudomonas syringae]|nr:GNAT family N-acetyltransferase [Pseudomonas syringae]
MEAPEVLVLQASYTNPVHADAIGFVLNEYSLDVMGTGRPLSADTRQQLAIELAKRPHAFSVLAFVSGEPVGLINCFEGFSTFACRPLVNIHDVAVIAQYRG